MHLSLVMATDRPNSNRHLAHCNERQVRFYHFFQGAKKLAIAMSLLLIWWSASFGPLRTEIFSTIWTLLGFVFIVLSVPVLFYVVFPPPFTTHFEGETPEEQLARERIKLILLLLITSTIFAQVFFLSESGFQWQPRPLGYAVIALPTIYASWLLRHRQMRVVKAVWGVIIGKQKK